MKPEYRKRLEEAFVVYVRMCFTLIFQMYCWI